MEAFQKVGVFIAFGIAWNSWINAIYEQRKRLVRCTSFFDNWWFLQFLAEFCTVLQCAKYARRHSVITLESSVKVFAKESLSSGSSSDNKGLHLPQKEYKYRIQNTKCKMQKKVSAVGLPVTKVCICCRKMPQRKKVQRKVSAEQDYQSDNNVALSSPVTYWYQWQGVSQTLSESKENDDWESMIYTHDEDLAH